ncbi:MAG: M28 family peptidase [Gemmatimonadaceae bacterium]
MPPLRRLVLAPLLALACSRSATVTGVAPARSTAAISASDLRARLFAFAHDSMQGREPGYIGNFKASAYMAAEFARIGLQPAGDNGTWFQVVPFYWLKADGTLLLTVDGAPIQIGTDIAPMAVPALPRPVEGASVIFGGSVSDPSSWIDEGTARGHVVILSAPASDGTRATSPLRFVGGAARAPNFASAALVCIVGIEAAGSSTVAQVLSGSLVQDTTRRSDIAPIALISTAAAHRLLGASPVGLAAGTVGRTVHGRVAVGIFPLEYAARNVVAVLPGSDPALRGQYVSLTAHNDHVGFDRMPVDHDSLRAFNRVIRPMGADTPPREPNETERVRIRTILDSLRTAQPTRADSIRNGADDDGTGSVALVEVAEQLAAGPRPKRSVLFVSHTAEEYGLLGSKWFTDHPTVTRDSIVSEIDMDMIGRGGSMDLPDAGPAYIEVIGLRRLSSEFGDIMDRVNARQAAPFKFNLTYDQPGHPLQYYCRADHYMYARYGIPSIALSRGEHLDYHQVTDEAQYIDYDALARVATLVHDAALELASLDHRPKLDKPKGDPNAPCRQ